jgi:hypothetical protein
MGGMVVSLEMMGFSAEDAAITTHRMYHRTVTVMNKR